MPLYALVPLCVLLATFVLLLVALVRCDKDDIPQIIHYVAYWFRGSGG
jgi:hypothetical protein